MMRNRLKIHAPGSTITVFGSQQATVNQVLILPGGAVQYQLGWFESGDRKQEWLFDFELGNCKQESESIIITTELAQ